MNIRHGLLLLFLMPLFTLSQSFELKIGEAGASEYLSNTLEFEGSFYSIGSRYSPQHPFAYINKISLDGEIVESAWFPKTDTGYTLYFGLPKTNGNLFCFGGLSHMPTIEFGTHAYFCEISPNLEIVWEKADSLPAYNNHTSHRIKNFLLTPSDEIVIQGVVDTALEGTSTLLFLARYDFMGNRHQYNIYTSISDHDEGSELFYNLDSTGFYLFGSLSMPSYKEWALFDLDFNVIGSGEFEDNQSEFTYPASVRRLSNGNFVIANMISKVGDNFPKGLEMRQYSPGFELIDNVLIYDDKTVAIPMKRGMGFIDENNIWVATFERIPPGIPGITGEEVIKFYVFDASLNLNGTKVFQGDRRYWLFDLLATSDGGCLISGTCDETPISTDNDAYIHKVNLADVVTGKGDSFTISGELRISPNPADDKLTVQIRQDHCELLIYNIEGKMITQHSLMNGVNIIDIQHLLPNMYIATVRSINRIVGNIKIIKQ